MKNNKMRVTKSIILLWGMLFGSIFLSHPFLRAKEQLISWKQLLAQTYPFQLPNLPYDYNALQEVIDQETMIIHHQKHHATYVQKANDILSKFPELHNQSVDTLFTSLVHENTALRNQLGGHINHTFFWNVLSSKETTLPKRLKKEIEKNFGSMETFKKEFENKGASVFGSGWVWLVRTRDQKLEIVTTPNQDNPLMQKNSKERLWPILGIDVWEHAYYLRYQNRRSEYLSTIWKIINWEQVNRIDLDVLQLLTNQR